MRENVFVFDPLRWAPILATSLHKNYYMAHMRNRQPFYQKDIHNSTFYHNHRYFAEERSSDLSGTGKAMHR